jgi:transcriptional regulator with XRE-family HTH domain
LNSFGQKVRELREKKGLLLRQVAAYLEVDTAMVSKFEKGDRKASKEQVIKIAEFLESDKDSLITLWLADRVESAVGEERKLANNALNIVKRKLKE